MDRDVPLFELIAAPRERLLNNVFEEIPELKRGGEVLKSQDVGDRCPPGGG
jgi:hypothetical protein